MTELDKQVALDLFVLRSKALVEVIPPEVLVAQGALLNLVLTAVKIQIESIEVVDASEVPVQQNYFHALAGKLLGRTHE
jgi:hypothetical protein